MLPKILPAGNMPPMPTCPIEKHECKVGPEDGVCCVMRRAAEELRAREPPTVTPIGNLHDLVAQVCGGDCDPE